MDSDCFNSWSLHTFYLDCFYIMKCSSLFFQKGDNAIHMAARTGRLGVIKRLKRKGDDLEKRNIVSYHIVMTYINSEELLDEIITQ